jgi:hypothetical protein
MGSGSLSVSGRHWYPSLHRGDWNFPRDGGIAPALSQALRLVQRGLDSLGIDTAVQRSRSRRGSCVGSRQDSENARATAVDCEAQGSEAGRSSRGMPSFSGVVSGLGSARSSSFRHGGSKRPGSVSDSA